MLKPVSMSEAFLSAERDGSISVTFTFNFANQQWRPFKNENGSWSFQSAHGTWLHVRSDGKYELATNIGADGRFLLESYAGII